MGRRCVIVVRFITHTHTASALPLSSVRCVISFQRHSTLGLMYSAPLQKQITLNKIEFVGGRRFRKTMSQNVDERHWVTWAHFPRRMFNVAYLSHSLKFKHFLGAKIFAAVTLFVAFVASILPCAMAAMVAFSIFRSFAAWRLSLSKEKNNKDKEKNENAVQMTRCVADARERERTRGWQQQSA